MGLSDRWRRWGLGLLAGCLLVLLGHGMVLGLRAQVPSSPQGSLTVEAIAAQIYTQVPAIPLENQYLRADNGAVDPEHTLLSRLIRYHRDVTKRPTRYRFDWKLTLADYLGINEPMKPETYPGNLTLKSNPFEKDIQAIRSLNRKQREALVDLLVQAFKPVVDPAQKAPVVPQPSATPAPTPTVVDPTKPVLSKPGDAQLLLP
ncbi:hypothetical protein [Synechocystis sp. LKSZ1]|uniref:hypothetical protein n=1 Tax=Synechocystis sp. LKSZ1 TaxID=3144951 RepID=UPI00336BFC87